MNDRTKTIQMSVSPSGKTASFTTLPKRLSRADLANLVLVAARADEIMVKRRARRENPSS